MPNKIKILFLSEFDSRKNGKHYYVAYSEIPNFVPGMWSTIRLTCLSDKPIRAKVGDEVSFILRSFDGLRGEGQFTFV